MRELLHDPLDVAGASLCHQRGDRSDELVIGFTDVVAQQRLVEYFRMKMKLAGQRNVMAAFASRLQQHSKCFFGKHSFTNPSQFMFSPQKVQFSKDERTSLF